MISMKSSYLQESKTYSCEDLGDIDMGDYCQCNVINESLLYSLPRSVSRMQMMFI